jgi:5-formyltetrahydrofolate cyclo-ligase
MGERKHELRIAALSQRRSLSHPQFLSWSASIQERALQLDAYLRANAVALYSSFENEVSTDAIFDHAQQEGKTVYYPRIGERGGVELVEVGSRAELYRGRYGILEPKNGKPLASADHSRIVVFVPGVAFDCSGNRIGRGGGGYDRLLAELEGHVTTIGLAYEFQIIGEVPCDPWDSRVHYLITERRIIDCDLSRGRH